MKKIINWLENHIAYSFNPKHWKWGLHEGVYFYGIIAYVPDANGRLREDDD